jgi:hypothetical protein
LLSADSVEFIEGKEYLKFYSTAPDVLKRFFCSECGTHVYNWLKFGDDDASVWLGLFPDTFDTIEQQQSPIFAPEQHVNCASARILDKFDEHFKLPMPNRDD